ncbi:MAG: hypothetical protein U0835_27045 [Isosphaeraceae bacterium]
MKLLLGREAPEILAFLRDASAAYARKHRNPGVAASHGPVSAVALRFDSSEKAGIDLCLDTRRPFVFDRTWSHESFGRLARPHWAEARRALQAGGVDVVGVDGTASHFDAESSAESWAAVFGRFLVGVVGLAEAGGLLASLPRQPGCVTVVDDVEGFFTWR